MLLLGTLFGSGSIWSWQNSQTELVRLQMERTKASLELRDKKYELLIDIASYNSDYNKIRDNYTLYHSVIDDFNALEKHLARLEEREAKTVDFEGMIPKPPFLKIQ